MSDAIRSDSWKGCTVTGRPVQHSILAGMLDAIQAGSIGWTRKIHQDFDWVRGVRITLLASSRADDLGQVCAVTSDFVLFF